MNLKNIFFAILLAVLVCTSSFSAFAGEGQTRVNQDASKTKDLVCWVDGDPSDGYEFTWYKNGDLTSDSLDRISTSSLVKGDEWRCEVHTQELADLRVNWGWDSTVVKNSAPVFTSSAVTSVAAGAAYSYSAHANDVDSDSLTYSITGPAWLSINPNTGVVSGTAGPAGTYQVTVSATDSGYGQTTTSQTFALSVTAAVVVGNQPPVFTSSPVFTGQVGVAYSYDVNAADPNGDAITYSLDAASLARGMTINAATGMISWVPTTTTGSPFPVVVSITDSVNAPVTQSFSISVSPASGNTPPVYTSSPGTSATAGNLYSYDANAFDANGDPLTFALTTFPTGMTINTVTGMISWTPSAAQAGNNAVVVTVSDGVNAPVPQTFAIFVSTQPAPGITTTSCSDAVQGKSYTCDINGAGGVGTLRYSLVSSPSGMTINSTTGVISWKPSSTGTFSFTVRVTDLTTSQYSDRTYQIKVTSSKPQPSDLFVDSIQFDDSSAKAGGSLLAYVTIENDGAFDFNDMTVDLAIDDLGIKSTTDKFNLDSGEKKTITVLLNLPNDLSEDTYDVRVTISNDDVTVNKHRAMFISGVVSAANVGNPISNNVVVTPTPSLTSYVPPAPTSELNWLGILFMIIVFVALIALAVYLVRMARVQNVSSVAQVADDSTISFDAESFY